MRSVKAAGLFVGLPLAIVLSLADATAQDSGTTVAKKPPISGAAMAAM